MAVLEAIFSVAALTGIAKDLLSEYCRNRNIKSNRSRLKEMWLPSAERCRSNSVVCQNYFTEHLPVNVLTLS